VDDLGPRPDGSLDGDFNVTAEVTCQQFVEVITDYLEGSLATRTLTQVEEHLVMCDWCLTYLEQMQATIASLGALRETDSPEPSEALLSLLLAKEEGGR
jgi:predicted anti-sigma-YlaC factor YlaD